MFWFLGLMSSISKVMANFGIIVRAKNVSIAPGENACNKKFIQLLRLILHIVQKYIHFISTQHVYVLVHIMYIHTCAQGFSIM